jgi:hypothetical protein
MLADGHFASVGNSILVLSAQAVTQIANEQHERKNNINSSLPILLLHAVVDDDDADSSNGRVPHREELQPASDSTMIVWCDLGIIVAVLLIVAGIVGGGVGVYFLLDRSPAQSLSTPTLSPSFAPPTRSISRDEFSLAKFSSRTGFGLAGGRSNRQYDRPNTHCSVKSFHHPLCSGRTLLRYKWTGREHFPTKLDCYRRSPS